MSRVFLAGAAGAVGRRLVPQLVRAGHEVWGTTRSQDRAGALEAAGATPVVVDVFDRDALSVAVSVARPDAVIHQLTDLGKASSGPIPEAVLKANARLREEGTRNLVEAAIASGARRFIAQSIAWMYAAGPEPHRENDPLEREAKGPAAISLPGVVALERLTLESPPLQGVVLRYGRLYGPGTWNTAQGGRVPVHVDAAARAALLALGSQQTGIFNIAEEEGLVSCERARRLLGWSADFRLVADPLVK
ncbi:MAG TPA: NAD-dependent epimerase/dehydratase family protein [Burkholderiales bacterium]|nr:NAD-dependent epimerase/dehydratase family protein [Burkholderiales bacterium]